jgi:hypothetical protein
MDSEPQNWFQKFETRCDRCERGHTSEVGREHHSFHGYTQKSKIIQTNYKRKKQRHRNSGVVAQGKLKGFRWVFEISTQTNFA